ncbi:hypothetical protein DL98DRAFT_81452 [Cadophora sp. DSE1049]|nr:hypothetical protein DL98DRAFT_81452 [Cadophora sp. DSE1049]
MKYQYICGILSRWALLLATASLALFDGIVLRAYGSFFLSIIPFNMSMRLLHLTQILTPTSTPKSQPHFPYHPSHHPLLPHISPSQPLLPRCHSMDFLEKSRSSTAATGMSVSKHFQGSSWIFCSVQVGREMLGLEDAFGGLTRCNSVGSASVGRAVGRVLVE